MATIHSARTTAGTTAPGRGATAEEVRGDVRAHPRRPWRGLRDAALVLGEYAAETVYGFLQPGWRRSGASPAEVTRRLPGDEVVPAPNWQATRAITIQASPAQIWPWLAQAGYGRGGWYADLPWWKDPEGHTGTGSSSFTLLPDHQHIAVGDVLLDGPNCDATTGAWTVVRLDKPRTLVLFSRRTLSGREVTSAGRRPLSYFACSWAFVLEPAGDHTTRLVVRTRARYRPAWMVRAAAVIRTGDTVMQRAMLTGIKRRVEQSGPSRRLVVAAE